MRSKIEAVLSASIPPELVKALLEAHKELKENFFFEKFRPSELEGGRFAEVMLRIVQHLSGVSVTPLNKTLPALTEDYLKTLSSPPKGTAIHDSLRLHIPRALFTIYGVRNRRDVGHVGGDVIPNRPDAYLVVTVCDWALAELIRLTFSNCTLKEAQSIVDSLIERRIPIVQDFSGFPKILKTDLKVPERIIAIAYAQGTAGFEEADIHSWLKHSSKSAINMALLRLERDKGYLHESNGHFEITKSGIAFVEQNLGTLFS